MGLRNGDAQGSRRDLAERRARDGFLPDRRLWPLVLVGAMVLLLAACTEEGQQQVSDALENVSATGEITLPEGSVPEEAAPDPEPETTTAPEPDDPADDEDGLSSSDWVLLLLLGIAAVALIAAAISAAGRYSASKSARRSAVSMRIGDIVGSSRWIHDSGSMAVLLVQDPNQVQSAWAPVRTRMMDAESQIATLGANVKDEELRGVLHDLGQAVTGLRSAEEAYVTAKSRAVGVDGEELLRSSYQSVIDRRRDLQLAIEPLATQLSYR